MDLSWSDFLGYLAGEGVAVAVGVLASELARYVPGFEALAPKWKRVAFLVLCMLVPLLASALGILTVDWPFSWSDTIWPAIVAGGIAFGSGTLVHTRRVKDWRAEIVGLHGELSAARAEARARIDLAGRDKDRGGAEP